GVDESLALEIFRRDRFTCRYCDKPSFFFPVLVALSSRKASADVLRWKPSWKGTHPIFWTHGSTIDHLVPKAKGGSHDPRILRTACYLTTAGEDGQANRRPRLDGSERKHGQVARVEQYVSGEPFRVHRRLGSLSSGV